MGQNEYEIWTKQLWDGVTLAQNGTLTSDPIQLDRKAENWRFSFQYYFTSDGAATITAKVLTSIDGVNFIDTSAAAIGSTLAKATRDHVEFDPDYCKAIKIQIDEDNVAAITSLTAWICIS